MSTQQRPSQLVRGEQCRGAVTATRSQYAACKRISGASVDILDLMARPTTASATAYNAVRPITAVDLTTRRICASTPARLCPTTQQGSRSRMLLTSTTSLAVTDTLPASSVPLRPATCGEARPRSTKLSVLLAAKRYKDRISQEKDTRRREKE